jgi:cysteine synthase A
MRGKAHDGILATIGHTPLVRLRRLRPDLDILIYAKAEMFNPGGSAKDRSALSMLMARIRDGTLTPGVSVVVESSSGNLAVSIAQICRYHAIDFLCVVDARTPAKTLATLHAYEAIIEMVTDPDPATGEYLPVRKRRVHELVATIPHAYSPDQYSNPLNPQAHQQTMREICEDLDGQVDYLFAAVGSFGTLRGCAEYLRAKRLSATVVAVDAVGSAIFGHTPKRCRLIPGHGAAEPPPLLDLAAVDEVVHVTDLECIVACRQLAACEAFFCGGSSGATVAALDKIAGRVPPGSRCVLIFPDGGDRYLDTVYSDSWVREHFGEISHLWHDSPDYERLKAAPCS